MKKALIVLLALPFLAACAGMSASSGLTEEQEAVIPEGASSVVVESDMDPDELYLTVKDVLAHDGYSFATDNPDLRRMVTEEKNPGRRMRMHVIVRILPLRNGSQAELTGKWAFEQTSNAMESTLGGTQRVQEATRDAAWIGNPSSRFAYARLVLLAEMIPDVEVAYR